MMDERAFDAARRAAEATVEKNTDETRRHFNLLKSAFRILGSVLFIILGFIIGQPLLSYGAGMFFAAEVFGIAEELI